MIKLFYPKFWYSRGILAYLLWPLSLIYYFVFLLRQWTAKPTKLSAKVICVGNVSIGGTGKTQLVIWLAKYFKMQNIKFVIVSNAYNSQLKGASIVTTDSNYKEVGDEALLLAKYNLVIACKRVQDSFALINQIQPEIVIFDDRLQNPHFHKDCKILLIDNQRQLGNKFLIPAGPLRQTFNSAIHNTDIIVTIGNQLANTYRSNKTSINAKIIAINRPGQCDYIAFCGIGNPERFFETLKLAGYNLIHRIVYPDHHEYNNEDILNLKQLVNQFNAKLITTTKDYLKLYLTNLEVLEVDLEFDDVQNLLAKINEKIS